MSNPFRELKIDFFGPTGAEKLRQEVDESGGPIGLANYERHASQLRAIKGHLKKVSWRIDPEHRNGIDLGEDGIAASEHLLNGALLAIGGLRICLPDKHTEEVIDTVALKFPDPEKGEDPLEVRHRDAQLVLEMGQMGLRLAESYSQLYEDIELQLCPDVTKHIYVQAGFGVVFSMVDSAIETAEWIESKKLAEVIDAGEFEYDWDEAFKSL